MFDKKYIAGIASFAGVGVNNVKAADNSNGAFTIVIDNKEYSLEAKKIANVTNLKDIDGLLKALEGAKANIKDINNNAFSEDIRDELYFVKSIQPGESSTSAEIKMDNNFAITLTGAKAAKIELVSKRKCIKFKYTGKKQLATAVEDELLGLIIQGKTLKDVSITNLTQDAGNKLGETALGEDSKIVGSNDIKLFENNPCILTIDSTKIGDAICKTVVCKFADGTEANLVKGVDLENLCNLFGTELKQNNRKLSDVVKSLNKCKIDGTNDKFFKDLNGVSIKKDGSDEANDKVTDENAKDFSAAKFVVVDGIKEANINPIFLKKNFTVEFDKEGDNTKKVDDPILNKIQNALNNAFENTVVIKVSGITNAILGVQNSKANDIILSNAFDNLSAISIEGVEKKGAALAGTDVVNSKNITVKLKAGVFAAGIVKTEIKITCNLDNVKKGDKKLKGDVKNIISNILNTTLNEVTPIADIINKLNTALDGKFADESKKIADTDINFDNVKDGNDIKKSAAIIINESFVNKLKDECFEDVQKDQGDDNSKQNGESSKGTNGDGGSGDGNKDPQKGCCGSNKK